MLILHFAKIAAGSFYSYNERVGINFFGTIPFPNEFEYVCLNIGLPCSELSYYS